VREDIINTVKVMNGVDEVLLERITAYTIDHIQQGGSTTITEMDIRIAVNDAVRFNIVRMMGNDNTYPSDVLPYILDDSARSEWETHIKKYVVPFFIKYWRKR